MKKSVRASQFSTKWNFFPKSLINFPSTINWIISPLIWNFSFIIKKYLHIVVFISYFSCLLHFLNLSNLVPVKFCYFFGNLTAYFKILLSSLFSYFLFSSFFPSLSPSVFFVFFFSSLSQMNGIYFVHHSIWHTANI